MAHQSQRGIGAAVAILMIVLLAGGVWAARGQIRSYWQERSRPQVPAAQPFVPQASVSSTTPSQTATSSVPQIPPVKKPGTVATTTEINPFADNGPLPTQVNLAVPFLAQAPKQNWDMPYQEACEEASMLMVHAFYEGKTTAFTPEEGDRAILDLVAFEESKGKTPDLTAAEVVEIMKQKWGYDQVLTKTSVTATLIKRALANGYPVIIPVDGKALKNPRFRNGGPPYHMLVIKGYVGDQYWITNDPGTKFGPDFTYPIDHLVSVSHDWNGGDVPRGEPVILVAVPRVQ